MWAAVGIDDIKSYVSPAGSGTITVTEVEAQTGGDNKVIFTATPAGGYEISKTDIIVQPVTDPSQTRAPGIASELEVNDGTSPNEFYFILPARYDGAIITANFTSTIATVIDDLSGITNPFGNYKFSQNFSATRTPADGIGSSSTNPFRGRLEGYVNPTTGEIKTISLSSPLFDYVKDATIKDIIVTGTISGSGNVGAIAGNALGDSRIYNCGVLGTITTLTDAEGKPVKDAEGNYQYTYGSTIEGNNNVGSIVGLLDGSSRVINCFSFAKILSGSNKGGIVGYNSYESKAGDIRTMVMNCMFYGDIASGNTISPVYGGNTINNVNDVDNTKVGLNTYNYYRYESLYSKKKSITTGKYNCALAVKEQYLTRFEIYRQLLNSNRKLAAWYATGDAEKGKGKQNEMAKWVLDKSKAPYPILMSQAYYPSVVNYDENKTYNAAGEKVDRSSISVRSQGGYIKIENSTQELTINISLGSGAPTNAAIISAQITRKRIDKDTLNYNFNYDKVQLPYFSEVGTGNYGFDNNNKSRVVTGWKITGFGGSGTEGTFNKTDAYGGYNFADRNCTNKDLYDAGDAGSDRVFSQGAYFDVPYGVTSINIEPFWGYAAYVSDPYYDIVYKTDYTTPKNVTDMGVQNNYNTSSKKGSISIGGSTQTVYTSVATAVSSLPSLPTGTTAEVYHYAVVLVGNMHLTAVPSNGDRPFTIMSADLDEDREPDYSLIYSHASRNNGTVSPIRFDFINVPGTAMAQKPNGASLFRNVSIFKPKGWFEISNTCQVSIVQFEYDNGNKSAAPVILLGGEIEQFVSTQSSTPTVTQYIHVGGNAWFKEFNNGTHSDGTKFTPHIPISATGGDYDKFYLSGAYKPDAEVSADNAEGYISGGRFGEVAGAGQQQIDGDVHWQIYDADIRDFYGGGINSDKPITGNITVDIYNSHVKTYCGGPKFGDNDKTVTTNATGCTFGDYFGAGYGGIAYVRKRTQDAASLSFGDWIRNYTDNRGNYYNGTSTKIGDSTKGEKAGPGVAVDFDYEFFVWSTGETGGRFYIKYASLSFATTNDVNSTLNNCHITHNFYGGGNLGKVDGNATSALNGCTVDGEVFGAGYSASRPKVPYRDGGFSGTAVPGIDTDAGVFTDGVKVTITDDDYLTLEPGKTLKNAQPALGSGTMYTNYTEAQLNSLGTVAGKVTLTIDNYAVNSTTTKETSITGNVYGGGESSDVYGVNSSSVVTSEVEVNIKGGSMVDVYGGGKGKTTVVGGDVTVNVGKLKDGSTNVYEGNATVTGSVYGGSALGVVNAKKDTDWDKETNPDDLIFIDGKETKVNILKGTVNGNVYGGGLGDLASLGTGHSDVAAKVFGDVTVTVGAATETAATTVPIIEGSVYGGSNVNGELEKGARVDIISGSIGKETTTESTTTLSGGNVHGGGYGQPTLVKGDVIVNVGVETNDNPAKHYGFATIKGDVYGGSAKGNVNAEWVIDNSTTPATTTLQHKGNTVTNVNLYGGTIKGDLYGGGLGAAAVGEEGDAGYVAPISANVYGAVTVTVEGGTARNVFGCNNIYGTPKGTVKVVVNGTGTGAKDSDSKMPYLTASDENIEKHTFDIIGVFGGGNQATYSPTGTTQITTVTISGCDKTSIKEVYGGGNAADVPSSAVNVNGAFEIGYVYNGAKGTTTTAANVGKQNDATYGSGNATTTIRGGTIYRTFGGSNTNGNIFGTAKLDIADATGEGTCGLYLGEVFSYGNRATMSNPATVLMGCLNNKVGALYGGAMNADINSNVVLNINGGTYKSVFGGNKSSGVIRGAITVNIEQTQCDIKIDNLYTCGNEASYTTAYDDNGTTNYYTDPQVNVISCTSIGAVYGAGYGENAVVTGNPIVNINMVKATGQTALGTIGNVYGGGYGADVIGNTTVNIGTEANVILPSTVTSTSTGTSAEVEGANITGSVFGGGYGETTNVSGNVTVTIGRVADSNSKLTIGGDVYGGSAKGIVNYDTNNTTQVNLCNGIITGNVYGGGLGVAAVGTPGSEGYQEAVKAIVKGNVIVNLNENDGNCQVNGSIFGCNNIAGSPEGHVLVHVFKTVKAGNIKDTSKKLEERQTAAQYDLTAVFGGGNQADYLPTTATDYAEVIIDGCDKTSIQEVYGGGYGAATPSTLVKILGTYFINEVFGGGYGAGDNNPGANVGYYTYKNENEKTAYTVGDGKAQVKLYGGMVHTAYGGSNTKGNIRVGSSAGKATDIEVTCSLQVKNIYGAGKNADQDGGTDLVIGCIPGLKNVYGGARDANIKGGVNLVITGGDFENVFGGNDTSGTIQGPIKVFIEESCDAINIQNLYLGGNLAAYSVYGYYKDTNGDLKPRTSATDTNPVADGTTAPDATTHQYPDPQLYVTKFTKIDNVYGGGYGIGAVMYGNPTVNINGVKNLAGNLGEIGNVYGGGDAANVEGNTTVNIGTEKYAMLYNITAGVTDVTGYYTRKGAGSTESPYVYTLVEPEAPATTVTAQANTDYYMPVLGAKMTGNVFGGGNKADVAGNTFVNICAVLNPVLDTDSKPTGDYTYISVDHSETTDFEGISIGESVYGGGSEADVKGNTRVTMTDGYVFDGVYGGGLQGSVGTFERATSGKPDTWTSGGKCTVVISGGQVGPVEVALADGGMKNTAHYFNPDGPVDVGFVFGAGRGEVENLADDPDADFHTYVKETEVTISGTALIMASVYGGGENGRVRGNTKVKIEGGQIGCGVGQIENGKPKRYTDGTGGTPNQFIDPTETPVTETNALVGCATWDYGAGLPYDPLANLPYSDGTTVTDASTTGSNGHTYYGSVFGGGSGYYPYEIKDASNNVIGHDWLESAGLVEGNTEVEITGGHILTSVYGGNELTNVGGTCTVTMSGGTIGVPRTKTQIEKNPSIGNIFGAGKGDKRVHFNTWTNVKETIVNVKGGIVYGSVFGGGEDGHVRENATTLIEEDKTNNKTITIGSTGESGADGNVFGGGRGSETALTAGVVGGNVSLTIESGNILGSVYGGGRLAAVGTNFVNPESTSLYGALQSPEADHGNIIVNINGGTIGTPASTGISGNIYGGSKGTTADFRLGLVRSTAINMTGGMAYASVYGGGELAQVVGSHTTKNNKDEDIAVGTEINIRGGTIGIEKENLPEGTTYGATYGNVYGGGKGNTTHLEAGLIKTNTKVSISQASGKTTLIRHNIYGGGAYGSVGTITTDNATYVPGIASVSDMPKEWAENTGKAEVYVYGGTIGVDGKENGMVFASSRGDVGTPDANGVDLNNRLAWVHDTKLVIGGEGKSPIIKGSAYGSGENGHVFENSIVEIHNGTIGVTENDALGGPNYRLRGNIYGGGCGEDTYPGTDEFNPLAGIVLGTAKVTIDGGQVVHNVYGAGALGSVVGKTTVTIAGNAIIGVDGSVGGNVFGAARGKEGITVAGSNLANSPMTEVNINGGQIWNSVYGGGEAGYVKRGVVVNMTGGIVSKDVYGGGSLADTQTDNWNPTSNTWADDTKSALYTTHVSMTGGQARDLYGGGLGRIDRTTPTNNVEAKVYGNVLVELNGTTTKNASDEDETTQVADNAKGAIVNRVFGANNLNGSPQGNVTVHVYGTQNKNKASINDGKISDSDNWHSGLEEGSATTYDVVAVYGGGNEADYIPMYDQTTGVTDYKTQVIIEGCSRSSIKTVYGGGNAAAVPESNVLVKSAYEIEQVFGGGNGKDKRASDNSDNPGADIGIIDKAAYDANNNNGTYGTGNANTTVQGGYVHEVFGASNENGTIKGKINLKTTQVGTDCTLKIDKIYNAGKNADVEGDVNVILDCQPNEKVLEYYCGAENANVKGNVDVTITNGHFGKLFGGNNQSGAIFGHIKLNIEETGCQPIIIDELYGCGNDAAYSVYGYRQDGTIEGTDKPKYVARTSMSDGTAVKFDGKPHTEPPYADPEINIISATRIGKVFAGGWGANATVYGNPTVNINQIPGKYALAQLGDADALGAIGGGYGEGADYVEGGVYGGGNQAQVVGNTTVNIATAENVYSIVIEDIEVGTTDVSNYYTLSVSGTNQNPIYTYTQASGTASDGIIYYERKAVQGANIPGNVFGAGKGKADDVEAALVSGNTNVIMSGGTVKKSVYGGGELSQVAGNTNVTVRGGTIGTPNSGGVTYGGATYGNVYGGGLGNTDNVRFGLIKGNTNVTIENTTVGENTITPIILHNVYGGGAYGSVGSYTYASNDADAVISSLGTANTGVANITITGGTIGTTGQENGMIFGSSRGDVDAPGSIQDKLAWVYDTHVTIGTSGQGTTLTTPLIKGSVYGSGENGHTYHNAEVIMHSGTIGIIDGEKVTSGGVDYEGAAYPFRGNVYGGGCGTDKYYQDPTSVENPHDGNGQLYNPLAGIVYGTTSVTIDGGRVVRNVYGAGAMGSVGKTDATGAITSGGTTTIAINGGIVGVDGTVGDGNVFGAARGDESASKDMALVNVTNVTISGDNTEIKGNVYGGGQLGNVGTYTTDADGYNVYPSGSGACNVTMNGGKINGNVFGAGKGVANTFECDKAMVSTANVTISSGMVGTLDTDGKRVAGTGNVYGGGELGRVENNTVVSIGEGTNAPEIRGNVFGAGAGVATHGYSALVRGNAKVTIDGKAEVGYGVYGGGQIATVGRYKVVNDMPTEQMRGGECTVIVKGEAVIGTLGTGNVFGAGKGVEPDYQTSGDDRSKCMKHYNADKHKTENSAYWSRIDGTDYVWEYFATEDDYKTFLETLALATYTDVTIGGSAKVNGTVYGGSESGFVQHNAEVKILENCEILGTATTAGDVFGGGKGLAEFAEAGRVRGDTKTTISGSAQVSGNVYGGGELGYVGSFTADENHRNYTWLTIKDKTNTDVITGFSKVEINGGSVAGKVFGAGKGLGDTFWCEKAMVRETSVSISNGTVNDDVYGGGEVGRVDQGTEVKIGVGTGEGTFAPIINGDVFGAGAGLETHGYSALVRGNTQVTVGGNAKVKKNVYGGGEIAAVGKYLLDANNMPYSLVEDGLGICTVTIQGNADIGSEGVADDKGHVFGAGKGVVPHFDNTNTDKTKKSRRMTLYTNATDFPDGGTTPRNTTWEYDTDHRFVWEYFESEAGYLTFLETLALATQTNVTIGGSAKVKGNVYGGSESGFVQHHIFVTMQDGEIGNTSSYGNIYGGGKGLATFAEAGRVSGDVTLAVNGGTTHGAVYGGGELGIVNGGVIVNMTGGTIEKDVYGGGALANTNTGNWDATKNEGAGGWADGMTSASNTTTVNLLGGTIGGDAYGGGLGRLAATGVTAVEAKVFGDIAVNLGNAERTTATAFEVNKYSEGTHAGIVKSGRVFGCNNLNGSPQGNVTVTVNKTMKGNTEKTASGNLKSEDASKHSYHVAAVYGGGNLAGKTVGGSTNVIINGCDVSIRSVYGGGNAAEVPATDVLVNGAYEIGEVFGGGNGKDDYTLDGGANWIENPGANVNGNTNTLLQGGLIHEAYGGSNEKGTIVGSVSINTADDRPADCSDCPLDVEKLVGAGKNADVNGDLIMILGCKPTTKTPLVFGGADNANVNGNVEMTITSGTFGQVFGGNNLGGVIRGHIILNIEETGCNPIKIDSLYLGGNQAAYSIYGYYNNGTEENPDLQPRTAAMETVAKTDPNYIAPVGNPAEDADHSFPYAQPVLNVVSCTSIGKVFGGGLGAGAIMHADPTVNINMIPGAFANDVPAVMTTMGLPSGDNPNKLGIIGDVYGGGNEANVEGNTHVNIGTASTVQLHESLKADGVTYIMSGDKEVKGAYITGNVFGGGKGKADNFQCDKAMVNGDEGTSVIIGNGTVRGTVYGGGEIGRVENNTVVTIGLEPAGGTATAPVIMGNVFGAGKGVNTHGYSALVRGNTTVTVQGKAKVLESIFGGGEIASVGKYNIADAAYHAAHPEVEVGMPYSLKTENSGYCYVTVRGNAEIGPDTPMLMTRDGGPDDTGHVIGAGKGVLPYEGITGTDKPGRMKPDNTMEYYTKTDYVPSGTETYEEAYLKYIESLGLATHTDVTIGGNAFVKGSVYGGSLNGHVQHDTHVTIEETCQIGAGEGETTRFTATWPTETENISTSWKECAHWDYNPLSGAPYDPYAKYVKDGKYYYDEACTYYAEGGSYIAKDGHTYYGNVFGGGSGVIPYAPGKWHRAAGSVGGNTVVDIKGGHILTSVYGGNEQTDVGTYMKDSKGALVIPVSGGKCTINMTGGTVGVPRTEADAKAHPVTCYLFGAGKGDQRIFFNTWTNVINTEVNISGDARIYGSTFGGGEDGHVIEDAKTTISGTNVIIGTTGTSYVDGNVFGGGRGFSGDAQTAGTVGGNVQVNISDGKMLGSIYGGGRLASVGTQFTAPDNPNYGVFLEDKTGENAKTYGHVTVNISGGTIGNGSGNNVKGDADGKVVSGNVFGGSMGRLKLLDGITTNPIWPKMAQVKSSTVTISDKANIKRTVFGGGELGSVRDNATVNISGGTVGRDVYGAGYGSDDYTTHTKITIKEPDSSQPSGYKDQDYVFTPMIFAGCVGQNTYVNISGGQVKKSVYGGGEMASVGIIDCRVKIDNTTDDPVYTDATGKYVYEKNHKHNHEDNDFILSWPYHFENREGYYGTTHVNITGGRIGLYSSQENTFEDKDNGDVCGGGKGIAGDFNNYVFCANVGSSEVTINYPSNADPQTYEASGDCIAGAVYGGAENGHVMGNTKLTLKKGLIGHSIYGGGSGKGKFTQRLLKIGKPVGSTSPSDSAYVDIYSVTAGKVFGNTEIIMEDGYVVRNVYGGGNLGSVGKGNYAGGPDDYSTAGYGEKVSGTNNLWSDQNPYGQAFLNSGKSSVTITGGTVGYIDFTKVSDYTYSGLPYGNVFGGCRGESAPNIFESPRYLYCPTFFSGYVNETDVTIGAAGSTTGPKIWGSVYGGGMDGHVRRDANVTINSGEIGRPYTGDGSDLNNVEWLYCGNVFGAGSGIGQYKYDFNYDGDYSDEFDYTNPLTGTTSKVKETDYSTSAGSVTRFTKVMVNGGTIHRNVYGGGSLSSIGAPKIGQSYNLYQPTDPAHSTEVGKQTLNEVIISGGNIGDAESHAKDYGGHVFGGSRGDASLDNSTFSTSMFTKVNMGGGKVLGSVFGGGEVGIVKGSVAVNVTGGEVESDIYGGGALANTNTENPKDADGKLTSTSTYTTTVNLLGGTINDAFGGGLGQKKDVNGDSDIEAKVYGDVTVNLNGLEPADYVPAIHSALVADVDDTEGTYYRATGGCVVTGDVFGCNNYNGTPEGHAKVHVFKTVPKPGQAADGYDVDHVFGGGNDADYTPAASDTKQSTEVIIEGCDLTSIYQVYGGGNAAASPGTSVLVKGTKIIYEVFGGGNGESTETFENPGANVGYHTDKKEYTSGDGKSQVQLMAGNVTYAYGGSNSHGNIRGGSSVTNVTNEYSAGCCDKMTVQEIYAGGKNADMEGGAKIVMGCTNSDDWVEEVYAGAKNANVGGDVSLTLTSGKFGRVFGGNKESGILDGSITVNIEENAKCGVPLIIGELYGGGNKAAYSIYGYNADGTVKTSGEKLHASPVVNVRAFTSIGNIFGGGYGEKAVMYGSPTININVVNNNRTTGSTISTELTKTFEEGTDNEYSVKIPTHVDGKIGAINNVFGGGNAAKIYGDTNVNIGTEAKQKLVVIKDSGDPDYESDGVTPKTQEMDVVGADIRGNVYGGGNAAEVTGNTNVVIGKQSATSVTP